jgi:hypothetical protein
MGIRKEKKAISSNIEQTFVDNQINVVKKQRMKETNLGIFPRSQEPFVGVWDKSNRETAKDETSARSAELGKSNQG